VLKLIDMLEDLDDVQNVYSNAEIDEIMEASAEVGGADQGYSRASPRSLRASGWAVPVGPAEFEIRNVRAL
jgi:hypothetical protein